MMREYKLNWRAPSSLLIEYFVAHFHSRLGFRFRVSHPCARQYPPCSYLPMLVFMKGSLCGTAVPPADGFSQDIYLIRRLL